ncbi:hypothetical protein CBE37_01400 [bacterium TMED277]|nr:hypothetical protein [Candidatus Pelagibacter sp.]OUX44200.1 MAG: hypothetical protein CBE37_01400 [bacterium TMED277]|tara:strand:+ start:3113 stop:3739 length:627 start_codon:yes stop_codon:yes gene_type:complete
MNIKILDSFLEKKDLDDISSIKLEKVNKNEIRVYHNSIDKNNNTKTDCINSEILKRLQENYHDKAMNLLKELNPLKAELYDYSEFHIIETGADYQFPIHDDTPNKLLSGVIYIRPEKNSGTIFYENKKGNGKKIIDWEINRAVFFSRTERETWHSYKGDGKSNRIALVYNLMTNRIKEVYDIEKKSYLLGQLRYKLNPYIYRFFKFTI